MNNLRIDNPCPFIPTNRNKQGVNFYCKSCKKTIIDFRHKTAEEIKPMFKKDTCGIFTSDQLPGQQKMKLPRRIIFYGLTILSFFGFTIRPLSAQTLRTSKDSIALNKQTIKSDSTKVGNESEIKIEKKKKESGIFRRKKIVYTTTGCPSF